ncbi:MAG: hypothetical protein WBW81_16795 [Methylocella sp.]
MTKTLTRVYSDYASAELTVRELKAAGLGDSHISIVASNAEGWHKPGSGDIDPKHDKDRAGKDDRSVGVVAGAGMGVIAGGAVGLLPVSACWPFPASARSWQLDGWQLLRRALSPAAQLGASSVHSSSPAPAKKMPNCTLKRFAAAAP